MLHELTWHGHSAFELSTAGATVLIDPFFDGNPGAVRTSQEMTKADLVLVTHDHGDHVGQAFSICKATGAVLGAVVETAGKIASEGLPASQVLNGIGFNVGGTLSAAGVKVTMVQALHSSQSGLAVGYVLRLADGFTLYHAGDTALFAGMELIGRMHAIDLALLPIGGVFTMDARAAAVACSLLRCKAVVPMHWGSFPVLAKNTEAFADQLDDQGCETKLIVLTPGKTHILHGPDEANCDCG